MLFNNEKELSILTNEYNKTKSSIVLIKGNYGIGKTTLINQFIEKENITPLYYASLEENDKANRDNFRTTVLDYCGLPCLRDENFSWDLSFRCFINGGLLEKNKKVLIIEDLQYLIKNNHLFLSTLYEGYKTYFKEKNILLILTGNILNDSVEEMFKEENITSLTLEPLDFKTFSQYYPTNTFELYSLTNAMPFYMQFFNSETIIEDIVNTLLNKNHTLFNYPLNEAKKLLNEKFNKHFMILKCIVQGKQTLQEISKSLQLTKREVSMSLGRLIDVKIIKKDVSINSLVFGKNYETKFIFDNTLMGYYIKYNYLQNHLLKRNKLNDVINYIKEDFFSNNLISETYCKICYQTLKEMKTLKFDYVAKYFEDEIVIDLVAVNKKQKYIILGDCSYKKSKKGLSELEELASFYQEIILNKFKGYKVKQYIIFNEFGFDDELIEVSQHNHNLFLVSNKK